MLSGFNTNVRHRDLLFHVQSEDSGRHHPHVITHLYFRGTILASEKTSYADHVDAQDLPTVVKDMMETQHKAVLRRLVSGHFDVLIRERLGPDLFGDAGDTKAQSRPVERRRADAAELDPTREGPPEGPSSERPLDEVILNYLVESARQRKRRSK
jgi:hypothetical protein